jgi:hypothetical protein
VRVVVVASSPLAPANAPRRAAAPPPARAARAALHPRWRRRPVAGAADAPQAAPRCGREWPWNRQRLTSPVNAEGGPAKRAPRGRPPEHAPRPQPLVWRVSGPGHEATEAITARAPRERRLVRATHVLAAQDRPDAARLPADTGQPSGARRLQGAKPPAGSAPRGLAPPTRLAARGGVDWLALRGYPLVARPVRTRRVEAGAPRPDRPAPSPPPTARTGFQLGRPMAVVSLRGAGQSPRPVTALSPHQLPGIRRLGAAGLL